MTIWDDLYKDLIKSELRQDGISSESSEQFKTVEAKVDELRRRVCQDASPLITKEAGLKKKASSGFRLIIARDEGNGLAEIKSYISLLIDQRGPSIALPAVMEIIAKEFPHKIQIVNDYKNELRDFTGELLKKHKPDISSPIPMLNNKPEGGNANEDNKIFENISEKLKH